MFRDSVFSTVVSVRARHPLICSETKISEYCRSKMATATTKSCLICKKSFNGYPAYRIHLRNVHNWDNLNIDTLSIPAPWSCPYCKKMDFESKDLYLCHVLNSCPTAESEYFYMPRHDELLNVLSSAALFAYDSNRGWQVNSVTKDYSYYQLPHGIQNKPGTHSPDILIYNRRSRIAMIILLNVPWEANVPRAKLDALTRLEFWSAQFKSNDYNCSYYYIEIGSRGFISSSVYSYLKALHLIDFEVEYYAQKSRDIAIEYSKYLLEGRPNPVEDDSDDYDRDDCQIDQYDYLRIQGLNSTDTRYNYTNSHLQIQVGSSIFISIPRSGNIRFVE